jgi:hypothetical protein
MATFNNSGAYSILSTQKGTYYVQGGHYFAPATFVDLGTTAPTDYQSLSSERSDAVNISGGSLNGVTIGSGSTINAPISGPITGATITGGSINNTPIGLSTPASGAFTTLNSTSANILGPLIAEGVSSSANAQAPSPTNSGITWGSSPTWAMQSFYDQSNTANNRAADMLFISGSIKFRFANDERNAFLDVFSIAGGQASGVTGITSTSGSGDWAHTGSFSASAGVAGNTTVTAGIGSNSVQMVGAANGQDTKIQALGVTDANVSISFSAKGSGLLKMASPVLLSGGYLDVAGGLRVKEGANAKQGTATLVAGTVTVSNTSVTANSRIQLTVQSLGTVTRPAAVGVTARVAGTSFTIMSGDATDTSVVAYEIFEPGT